MIPLNAYHALAAFNNGAQRLRSANVTVDSDLFPNRKQIQFHDKILWL